MATKAVGLLKSRDQLTNTYLANVPVSRTTQSTVLRGRAQSISWSYKYELTFRALSVGAHSTIKNN
jgi:hypothetical protein